MVLYIYGLLSQAIIFLLMSLYDISGYVILRYSETNLSEELG